MTHTTYPVSIPLPGGRRAELQPGTPGQPIYAIDGIPVWLDVRVPSDLQKRGWVWNGAFLWLPAATSAQCGVGICTNSSPPPFWNVARDGRIITPGMWPCCFVVARFLDIGEREGKERRIERLAATAAKTKARPAARRANAVQTMMELV